MWIFLNEIIFPPTCPGCGHSTEWGKYWCQSCLDKVLHPRQFIIENTSLLHSIHVLGRYDKGLRDLLKDLKFNGKKGQTGRFVPFLQAAENIYNLKKIDMVIPIPVSDKSLAERGYNQVDIIFEKWCKKQNLPYVQMLVKLDHTKPMWQLHKHKRKENLEKAYMRRQLNTSEQKIWNSAEEILLVDVMTLGLIQNNKKCA